MQGLWGEVFRTLKNVVFQRRAKIAKNTFEVKFFRTESPANSGVCVVAVQLGHEVFHAPRVVHVEVAAGHPLQGC